MGDSPTENLMGHDIITDLTTSMKWATDSKEDVYRGSIGEGVESDIPDTGETSCRTTASNDSLTFVKNSYTNSEDASSGKVTAPLLEYSKFADVVLQSEPTAEDSARPGISGQREDEGRGKVSERQLKKGVIQSILSTLGNNRRFQRAVGPTQAREEPAAATAAGGKSSRGNSFVHALYLFSMSWLSGASRAQERSPKQVPVARSDASTQTCRRCASSTRSDASTQTCRRCASSTRSDTSAVRRSVAMIEEVGSRLHIMKQILQAHHSKGRQVEEEAAIFQKVVKELRLQLMDVEMMIAEIAPLVGKRHSNTQLLGPLEIMTTALLELREVLQVGPKYSGSFSKLDVQAAFIDARKRLKEAQYAASKLGPITVNSDI